MPPVLPYLQLTVILIFTKIMKYRLRIASIVLILIVAGFGCTKNSEPTTLQQSALTPPSFDPTVLIGRWHSEFQDGTISGYRDYTFYSDGSFAVEGYPEWNEYGTYEVTGYDDNNLVTISFIGTTGEQKTTSYQAILQFEPDGKSFNSPSLGAFTRAE